MQTTSYSEDAQQRISASAELAEAVKNLLDDSFQLIEQCQLADSDLEAGCLSCS